MIIIRGAGGLGNQMQQYALYQKFLSLGKDTRMDLSWFRDEKTQESVLAPRSLELEYFHNLPIKECTVAEKVRLTGGDGLRGKILRKVTHGAKIFEESQMYHPEIFDFEDRYLVGYFACNRYYADILPQLRKLFVFPESADDSVNERNAAVRNAMKSPEEYSISLHIRRGDYLDSANAALLGGICTKEYYESAAEYLEQKTQLPLHFYIFSDDSAFARAQHFGTRREPCTVIDWNKGRDSMLDMELMTHCRANVTANSTFSFWGGRLNPDPEAVLIRPLRHRNNQIPQPSQMHSLWEGWTLIDTDGKIV